MSGEQNEEIVSTSQRTDVVINIMGPESIVNKMI